MGFSFKLHDYFAADVLNMPFLDPFALALALFVVILEVILGVALLVGFKPKQTLWAFLGLIVFFSFLTFYSAYFNKVTDCGCFGDAIALTPWQSFTKDIVLLVFIIILMFGIRYIKPIASIKGQWVALGLATLACAWLGYYVLHHLPLVDFRAYAEGKSIIEGMKTAEEMGLEAPVYENIYTMQKSGTSERVEISSTQYMDEKWWEKTEWEMLSDLSRSVKVKDGYEPPVHDFSITTDQGDITEAVLAAENYLLIISYELESADRQAFAEIAKTAWQLQDSDIPVVALTAASPQENEAFRHEIQAPFDFASSDKTTLKTVVRSNPGVVWLKNGVVFKKWAHADVPDAEALKALK